MLQFKAKSAVISGVSKDPPVNFKEAENWDYIVDYGGVYGKQHRVSDFYRL